MDQPDGAAVSFVPPLYLLLSVNGLIWTNNQAPGFHLPQFPKGFHFVLPKCLQRRCVSLTQGTWQSRALKSLHWLFSLNQCLWRWKCCAVLSRSVVSDSLPPHGLEPARLLCPWDSPGKGTGVGFHALFQRISRPRDPTHVSYISCIDWYVLYH